MAQNLAGDEDLDGEEDAVPNTSSQTTKKGRGPSKGVQTKTPMFLEFDDFNMPTGEWEEAYGTHIGVCAAQLDINIREWKELGKVHKDNMWDETKRKFHIEDDPKLERKRLFLRGVSIRFRRRKAGLVARFITREGAPKEGNPNSDKKPWELYEGFITEAQWKNFEEYVRSPKYQALSEKGKQNAAKNVHRHRMGRKSYGRARKEWQNQKRLPEPEPTQSTCTGGTELSTTTTSNRVRYRGKEWILAREKKMPDGKWDVDPSNPETVRVAKLVREHLEKEAKEREEGKLIPLERGMDALSKALGKVDHRGHVKALGGCGVGVNLARAFGKEERKGKRSSQSSISIEEMESMKAKWNEEFEERLEEKVQSRMKEYEAKFEEMLEDRVTKQLHAVLASMTEGESGLKNTNFQPNLLEHGKSTQLEGPSKCRLAVKDPYNEDYLVIVADGTMYPMTSGVIHTQAMKPNHYKVSVDNPYTEHAKVDLPVESPDGVTKLGDARNCFLQWPSDLVIFDNDEVSSRPTKKSKSEVDSCGNKSLESIALGIDKDKLGKLGEQCELLYYCMSGADCTHDTTSITLDAKMFYLEEDRETWVTAQDISEFLRGACLNISVIQVYTMYLVKEYIEVLSISEITFLCPHQISHAEIQSDHLKVQSYLQSAFKTERLKGNKCCKFMLAPYVEKNHWVLLVIDLRLGYLFLFDPASCSRRTVELMPLIKTAYKVQRAWMNGKSTIMSKREMSLECIECPQQPGATECGYYVMRFMYEIVARYSECKGKLDEVYVARKKPFTDAEVDEVCEQWAKFFRIEYLLD